MTPKGKIPCNENGIPIGEHHHGATIPDEVVERMRTLHDHPLHPIGYRRMVPIIEAEFGIRMKLWTIKKILAFERRRSTPIIWKDAPRAAPPLRHDQEAKPKE